MDLRPFIQNTSQISQRSPQTILVYNTSNEYMKRLKIILGITFTALMYISVLAILFFIDFLVWKYIPDNLTSLSTFITALLSLVGMFVPSFGLFHILNLFHNWDESAVNLTRKTVGLPLFFLSIVLFIATLVFNNSNFVNEYLYPIICIIFSLFWGALPFATADFYK